MPHKKTRMKNKSLVEKAHHSLMEKSPLYSDWHGHPHQHKVQMIIFVMALFIFAGLLALRYQGIEKVNPVVTRADQDQYWMQQESKIADSTKNLLNLVQDYKKADSDVKAELLPMMIDAAQQRFYMVAAAADKRPDVVLHTAIPGVLRHNMPDEVAQYVEQEVDKQGQFTWRHADDFNNKVDYQWFYLDGQEIKFSDEQNIAAVTGDRVKIHGYELNGKIVANSDEKDLRVLAAVTAPVVRKTAVVMFNFQNNQITYGADYVRSTVFTGDQSVNSYYQANSYGQLQLSGATRPDGDIFGWYTIPYDNVGCQANYAGTWTTAANNLAARDGFNPANYNNIIYAMPGTVDCGFSGVSELGGNPAHSWITNYSFPLGVVAHEFGHTLTRMHASAFWCVDSAGNQVSLSNSCQVWEYNDPFDVMGNFHGANQMNVMHKGSSYQSSTNWLGTANTLTLDRSTNPDGVYTLVPTETYSATGIQSLRIPKTYPGINIPGYYYLEFRQPGAFDNFATTDPVVNGVSIRIGTSYDGSYNIPGGSGSTIANTLLVDTTPGSSNYFDDSALQVGQSFTDAGLNITITVLSVSASGAQVRVTFGALPCQNVPPTVTSNPSTVNTSAGLTASYNVTIKNNDSADCGSSTYTITPSLPSGWAQTPANWTETIAPGASVTRTVLITSDPNAASGTVVITETIANQINSSARTITYLYYTVQAVDRTPPVVTITKPANGSTIGKGKLNIAATASDNVYVTSIKLYLDSALVKTCANKTSCAGSVSGNSLASGAHTIRAVASDYNGNIGTATITVTK